MPKVDRETFEQRQTIINSAIELYLDDKRGFTIQNIAADLDLQPSDIYEIFPNKKAILDGYYVLLVERYRLMIKEIEDFNQYGLAEKLSNFFYASFDMMQERREFVEETFKTHIANADRKSSFQKEVESLFREFFKQDRNISSSNQLLMRDLLYQTIVRQYFHLVKFWLRDDSPDYERSMAYTDKLTSFIQEVMYTAVLDKGFDLLKFVASNDQIIDRIPVIGSFARKFLKE